MKTYQIPKGSFIAHIGNLVKRCGGLNLAQGIPGFQPPKELIQILNEISNNDVHQYPHSMGNFRLLTHLAQHYRQYYPLELDNFMIVQGATEGISLLYTYLTTIIPNPNVLVFDPPYESFTNLPGIFKHQVHKYPVDSEELDMEGVLDVVGKNKVNIIFICSPGNPYGRNFSKKEVAGIVEIARENNCYIIFDHVYKDIYFGEKSHNPLSEPYINLLYVNSFSKSFSITGWRIGYIVAHKSHINKIKPIHDFIGLCAPSLLQEAIAEYVEKHDFGKDYVAATRKKLNNNFLFLKEELANMGFKIPRIDGGYFIWARLPDGLDDGAKFVFDLFDKERVALIPGLHFSENAKEYIRINIGLEQEKLQEGVLKIKHFIKNQKP